MSETSGTLTKKQRAYRHDIVERSRRQSDGSVSGVRGYGSARARERAIRDMAAAGCEPPINYFVCFSDVQSPYALQYGHAAWVAPGTISVQR